MTEAAAGLKVSEATVFRWRYQDRVDRGKVPGTSTIEHAELAARRTRRKPAARNLSTTVDLVNRQFSRDRPDQVWLTDIERHEALLHRAEMKGLRCWAVAAVW